MAEPTEFDKLLKNFDKKAFCQYLMTISILDPSETEALLKLQTGHDDVIVSYLNQIAHKSASRRRSALQGTVRAFARHAFEIVRLALKGSAPWELDTQDWDSPSSSSQSSDDFTAGQLSQELPDQDVFTPGNQDPGYYTQSSSFGSYPSIPRVLLFQRTRSHNRSSKMDKSRKPRIVQNITNVHNNYYGNVMPSDSTAAIDSRSRAVSPAFEKRQFRHLLLKYNHDFTEFMNVSSLLPYLQRENLVTSNEAEELRIVYKTRADKNQHLLSILPSKGEDAMDRFVRCLLCDNEHSGHAHLASILNS